MKLDTKKPWVPDGYKLESHEDCGEVDVKDIELYLSKKQESDNYIKGEDLLKELKDKKPLNSAVLKYLLDNPKHIPEEWKGKYISFFGTILRSPNGTRRVLYLYYDGSQWDWDYHWLGNDWFDNRPSAVLASGSKDTCNQCMKDMQTIKESHVCANPACPNYALCQIALEDMPNKLTK